MWGDYSQELAAMQITFTELGGFIYFLRTAFKGSLRSGRREREFNIIQKQKIAGCYLFRKLTSDSLHLVLYFACQDHGRLGPISIFQDSKG